MGQGGADAASFSAAERSFLPPGLPGLWMGPYSPVEENFFTQLRLPVQAVDRQCHFAGIFALSGPADGPLAALRLVFSQFYPCKPHFPWIDGSNSVVHPAKFLFGWIDRRKNLVRPPKPSFPWTGRAKTVVRPQKPSKSGMGERKSFVCPEKPCCLGMGWLKTIVYPENSCHSGMAAPKVASCPEILVLLGTGEW